MTDGQHLMGMKQHTGQDLKTGFNTNGKGRRSSVVQVSPR